jgi:hypothetical protein
MTSLYGRLFKYRQRPDRSPHEDYLTEALCDLLNCVPRERAVSFVNDLLVPSDARPLWREASSAFDRMSWRTQALVPGGRIDLLLENGGEPLIAVECKISAGFHIVDDESAHAKDAEINQLVMYGRWLAKGLSKRNHVWPGALSIITHSTRPPADFRKPAGDQRYQVKCRNDCTWAHVSKWLRGELRMDSPRKIDRSTELHWKRLAGEFVEFIKEGNMSSDTIVPSDISALDVYIGSADRFDNTFRSIHENVISANCLGELAAPRKSPVEFIWDASARVLHDWVYLKARKQVKADWFFDWGIQLPSDAGWWEGANPPVPKSGFAFVYFGSDKSEMPLLDDNAYRGEWRKVVEKDYDATTAYMMAARELHRFVDATVDGELGSGLANWTAARIAEMKPRILKWSGE